MRWMRADAWSPTDAPAPIRRRLAQLTIAVLLGPFSIVFATWSNGEWML
ncbi:MAG: hypothetical protein AAGA17_01405 [Actinomycetota bacterium]